MDDVYEIMLKGAAKRNEVYSWIKSLDDPVIKSMCLGTTVKRFWGNIRHPLLCIFAENCWLSGLSSGFLVGG